MDTLEDELIGKTVMSKEGFFIGVIKSLLVDRNTGGPKSILVKPSKEIDPQRYKLDEQGDIIFPSDSISIVKDIVVVEKSLFLDQN